MTTLRFLAAVFALVALLALVVDMTPALTGQETLKTRSVLEHWQAMAPKTLISAQKSLPPIVWSAIERSVLAMPAFLAFGLLALISGYLGRRRRRVRIYVN